MARWMRNGEHGGTFRYATLTRDRFFSPIRHSTPLMTTLESARGAARRFFFSSSSSPFCLFLSKRLHNNRPYCDHGAPLNLNYYVQKKFSCLPASPSSLTREFITACCNVSLQRRGFNRASCFSCWIFLAFLFPRQLRNHCNGQNVKHFQNFCTYESSMIRTPI